MLRRRIAHGLVLLFASSILSFAFIALAPGERFDDLLLSGRASPESVEAMRARHGIDRPLPVRYARWLVSMARGDLGHSIDYNGPVAPRLLSAARNTLLLTVPATFLAWLIAIPVGILQLDAEGRSDRLAFAIIEQV